MTDTTDQQAVTVAQIDRQAAALIFPTHAMTIMSGGWDDTENVQVFARHRLASVSFASAEPRKDTVAFVQEWLMNSDYDPTQFDKGFAAAIDARHGFDDAALTAIAERFCAAPLPDTVCADLVAIKPMAGRSGTNLMTVAEAKAVLRSIFPEPVPATNQAAEVERLRAALEPFAGLANAVDAGSRRVVGVGIDGQLGSSRLPVGGSGIRDDCTITIDDLRAARAALATQPATSQEAAIPYGSWDTARIKTAIESKLNGVWSWLASIDGGEVDAEEARSKMDLIDAALKNLADIPDAQPATSQEGGARAKELLWLIQTDGVAAPLLGKLTVKERADIVKAMLIFAATPTPPTLSEDLREVLERVVRSDQVRDWRAKCDNPTSTSDWVWRDGRYVIIDWAALAQGQAS